MLKILVLKGAPASGKSSYCRELMRKEPGQWKRVNNDALREALDFGIFSSENEKVIKNTRNFLIKESLQKDINLIIDNVNANKENFEDVCKIAKEINKDIHVLEKCFYEDLATLIERDSQRIGAARVGEEIVKKFWKKLNGKQFQNYLPREEFFYKRNHAMDKIISPMIQDDNLPSAIISDLDGTLAKIGNRSPYSAANCDTVDTPISSTLETVKLYYQAGYKIIFCTGRMEVDREPTVRFIENCLPNVNYLLLMRTTNDQRKDSIIKEELFNNHIKNKYNVKLVMDDRLSVCRLWFNMGLNLFRVGDPDADF